MGTDDMGTRVWAAWHGRSRKLLGGQSSQSSRYHPTKKTQCFNRMGCAISMGQARLEHRETNKKAKATSALNMPEPTFFPSANRCLSL